jgi:hypothetical protein
LELSLPQNVFSSAGFLVDHDLFGKPASIFSDHAQKRGNVMLSTILIVILILLLIGALPTWPYSAGWGYYPGGGLGLVLVIVVVLALAGRI